MKLSKIMINVAAIFLMFGAPILSAKTKKAAEPEKDYTLTFKNQTNITMRFYTISGGGCYTCPKRYYAVVEPAETKSVTIANSNKKKCHINVIAASEERNWGKRGGSLLDMIRDYNTGLTECLHKDATFIIQKISKESGKDIPYKYEIIKKQ